MEVRGGGKRDGRTRRIQKGEVGMGERLADGGQRLRMVDQTGGGINGTFGRAVNVDKAGIGKRLQALSDTRFINVYGPPECTVDATPCLVDHTQPLPTIGQPLAHPHLSLLDAPGPPVPLAATAYLHTCGSRLARGYLPLPDLPAPPFPPLVLT
ncbi:AMP-binding protein, partial [Pectobacterium brasiliense]|uniref:AMP-binding protein n=1 Tax=Pectobacterium brasiliense TaxID=180957 RepID=UPI00191BABF4